MRVIGRAGNRPEITVLLFFKNQMQVFVFLWGKKTHTYLVLLFQVEVQVQLIVKDRWKKKTTLLYNWTSIVSIPLPPPPTQNANRKIVFLLLWFVCLFMFGGGQGLFVCFRDNLKWQKVATSINCNMCDGYWYPKATCTNLTFAFLYWSVTLNSHL